MIRAKRAAAIVMSVLTLMLVAAPAEAKGGKGGGGDQVVFAGYQWQVKSSTGQVGPGPNVFSERNVRVDNQGRLHLKISRKKGVWSSSEVILDQSLGHGTYRFTVDSALTDLDPNAVLGLFTWSDDPAQNHREIDIEFSRWGNPSNPYNAGYTVQPYAAPGHQHPWAISQTGRTVHEFTWTPDSISFRSTAGGVELASWTFDDAASVPDPGDAAARMNLWLFQGMAPTDGQGIEVVISDFSFTPLP